MNKTKRKFSSFLRHKYVKNIFLIFIIGLLFYFFLKGIKIKEVLASFKPINIIYPLVFCLGIFPQYLLRAYRWGIILKQHKKIPLRRLFNYTAIGYMINLLVPGKAGEPAKGILIARKENIKKGAGLASVVIERTLDFIFIFLLFDISIMFMKIPINMNVQTSSFFSKLSNLSSVFLFVFLILLISFYLINLSFFFNFVDKIVLFFIKIFPKKYKNRIYHFIHDFIKGLRLKLGIMDYLKLLFTSALSWIIVIPFYWFLINGYGFGMVIGIKRMVPWFAIIALSASLPIPMMAGTLDMGSKIAFENILEITDIPSIVAFTLFFHFLLILCQMLVGLWAKKVEGLKIKNLKKIKNEDNI